MPVTWGVWKVVSRGDALNEPLEPCIARLVMFGTRPQWQQNPLWNRIWIATSKPAPFSKLSACQALMIAVSMVG